MLIANLTQEVSIEIPVNITQKQQRIVDSFFVQNQSYNLGDKKGTFQTIFTKKIEEIETKASEPQNGTSGTSGESEPKIRVRYEQRKVFMVQLNEEELSTWGTNDEDLMQTIATKLGVEIASFTYIAEP